ncbi:putative major facilitator superfamily transporter [Caenibius tardaugens NBRC 16725]|uniref:Putative major facilitator superfamily transporter n=1 Tax=Caenibius tardaugens NBRC 16725 TaxID=1219035 RepID=U2YH75_9SPHN|nr:MFS transporter [Caenibius tardaugens]GAD47405.1 putative major facilitator superfamily transporter [Caenibius tardaugens NBRC 16725]
MTSTEHGRDSGITGPGRTLGPFRFPAFRAIWIANLFSNVGSMIQSVAAAWFMTELTDSHRLIALVQASTTLPILLFGVIAGAIADNFDRRRVMLTAQFGMLLASGLLALLSYEAMVNPATLLLLTLAVGIGTALNSPAWQASVRSQVGREDLPQAISLNTIAFNLARSVGPALGGLLISLWDISLAFALNAVSYIALIVVLLRWKPEVEPPVRGPMFRSIRAGLEFCMRSPPVRRVLLRGAIIGFGMSAYQALLPAVVRDQLGSGEIGFGLLLGAFGISSIVSALFVGKAMRGLGSELVTGVGTLTSIGAAALLAISHGLVPAMFAAVLGGIGWVMVLTTLNVAMQVRSPDAILGRCLAVYQAITFGGMAIGAWVWGAIADWSDLTVSLLAAAGWLTVWLVLLRIFVPMPQRGEGVHH